jgi:hypothetical protein
MALDVDVDAPGMARTDAGVFVGAVSLGPSSVAADGDRVDSASDLGEVLGGGVGVWGLADVEPGVARARVGGEAATLVGGSVPELRV